VRHWLEKVNLLTTTVILIFALALSACQPALTSVPAAVQPLAAASPAPTLSLAPPEATPTPSHTAALSELLNEVKACPSAEVDWQAAEVGQMIHAGGGVRTGATLLPSTPVLRHAHIRRTLCRLPPRSAGAPAYHEAGHAMACCLFGFGLGAVSIRRGRKHLGVTIRDGSHCPSTKTIASPMTATTKRPSVNMASDYRSLGTRGSRGGRLELGE